MWLNLCSSVSTLVANGSKAFLRPSAHKAAKRARGPRGSTARDRARVLENLGVDPQAQQGSWMSIIHCASHNSPALRPERLEAMLRARRDDLVADRWPRLS